MFSGNAVTLAITAYGMTISDYVAVAAAAVADIASVALDVSILFYECCCCG